MLKKSASVSGLSIAMRFKLLLVGTVHLLSCKEAWLPTLLNRVRLVVRTSRLTTMSVSRLLDWTKCIRSGDCSSMKFVPLGRNLDFLQISALVSRFLVRDFLFGLWERQ